MVKISYSDIYTLIVDLSAIGLGTYILCNLQATSDYVIALFSQLLGG